MADFYMRQGNTTPVLTATLTNDQDEVINLTGATVVFVMTRMLDGEVIVNHEAAILVADPDLLEDGAPNVKYTWQSGDTDESGVFRGEWQVTYGDGSTETFPNTGYISIHITEKLA